MYFLQSSVKISCKRLKNTKENARMNKILKKFSNFHDITQIMSCFLHIFSSFCITQSSKKCNHIKTQKSPLQLSKPKIIFRLYNPRGDSNAYFYPFKTHPQYPQPHIRCRKISISPGSSSRSLPCPGRRSGSCRRHGRSRRHKS